MEARKKTAKSAKANPTRRMGRPTLAQSRELDKKIRSAALNLFLDHGYDTVTMEAIAAESNITKRTLYMRYRDKSALFTAALRMAGENWLEGELDAHVPRDISLEDKLLKLGQLLLDQALDPRFVKLARIATAQANIFPDEIRGKYDMSLSPRIKSVMSVLEAHREELDKAAVTRPDLLADLFISMITGIPARLAGFGAVRNKGSEKARIRMAVKVFLAGIVRS